MLDFFIGDFIQQNKYTFLAYILIILIFFPIEGLLLPNVYGMMFERFKTNVKIENFGDIFTNIQKQNLPGMIILLVLVWVVIIGSSYIKHHVESFLVPEYMKYTRNAIYEKTVEAYSSDFRDMKTGEYLSRMLELTRNLKDLFQYTINRLIPESTVTVIIVLYLLLKQSSLGITIGITLLLCIIIQYYGSNIIIEKVKDREEYFNSVVSENIQDSLDNLMNVYLNNEVEMQIKKNESLERESHRKMQHIMSFQNKVVSASEIVIIIGYGISLYFIYTLLTTKKISIAEAIIYILVVGQFVSYMINVNIGLVHNIFYKLGIVAASRDHLQSLLNMKTMKTKTDCIHKGNIKFKNVYFKYDKDSEEYLIQDLSFELQETKKYGLIGRSGSGKTTLMKLLVGLYPTDGGEISIDDTDIQHIKQEYLREKVNYVNQKTSMFNEPIINNMLYGNDHITEEEMIMKLEKYKLLDVFSDLPNGVHASAGIHGNNLSGGMQKVTMLMRGIVKKCKIMILDEPLAGLDQNTRAKVIDMINMESEGKTLIVITHDKEILPHMEQVIDVNKL
jgi:ABC-type multidrug transport system fused ATPase/permease subunit